MDNDNLWIKKIEPELMEACNAVTLISKGEFQLKEFAKLLSDAINLELISMEIGNCEWRSKEALLNGLGDSPISLSFQLSPLEGEVFWIMSYEDICIITSWLHDQQKTPIEIKSKDLIKGLYSFIIIEALNVLKNMKTYEDFSIQLTNKSQFSEHSYAIDISINKGEYKFWGRLILSEEFQKSFFNHFAIKSPTLKDLQKIHNIQIPLSVIATSVTLTTEEVKSLQEGDFIILDNIQYRPSTNKGILKALIKNRPIFQIKLKDDTVKILDYIFAYKESVNG